MKFVGKVKLLKKQIINEENFSFMIERKSEMGLVLPGQFFNLSATKVGYPMLKRPISVSEVGENTIEFTIKIIGAGTKAMLDYNEGESIELMGPLGNGFEYNGYRKILVIGGGIGIAPLKGLINSLKKENVEIHSVLGYRDVPYIYEDFKARSVKIEIMSESDDRYRMGYVTEPVANMLEKYSYDMIYVCGPHPMLKSLTDLFNSKGIRAQLLMEEKMACGIGACLVCTCKTKNGDFGFKHSRMCKDGPMFYSDEVIFDE